MKKVFMLLSGVALICLLASCNNAGDVRTATPTAIAPDSPAATTTTDLPTAPATPEKKVYSNEEIPLSFTYPAAWGEPTASKIKNQDRYISSIAFTNGVSLNSISVPYEGGTCVGIEKKSLADDKPFESCREVNLNGPTIRIATFNGEGFGQWKEVHFDTYRGPWQLSTNNPALFKELEEVALTLKY